MSENSNFPAKISSPASVARIATNDTPLESSLQDDHTVQNSRLSELICPADCTVKDPAALFTKQADGFSQIPADTSGVFSIKTQIRNPLSEAVPMPTLAPKSELSFGGNFRSTVLGVAPLSSSNYSLTGAPISNSSSPLLTQVMGNTTVRSISENDGSIKNAQNQDFQVSPSPSSVRFSHLSAGSGTFSTGSGSFSTSPAYCVPPVTNNPVVSVGSLSQLGRVGPAVNPSIPAVNSGIKSDASPCLFRDLLAPVSSLPRVKTFAGVAEVMDKFFEPKVVDGVSGILFPDEVISKLVAPFKFSLIGRINGNRGVTPNSDILTAISQFELVGSPRVRFLPRGFMALILNCEQDFLKFSSLGTLSIGSVVIRFSKWTPEFNFAEESPLAPVWVRIPNLPLHLYSRRTLFMNVKLLGTPVEMDEFTADCSRGSFARVCVEIDVSQPHPDKIWVGWGSHVLHLDVVYERVPLYCSECKMLGHSSQRCACTGYKSSGDRSKAQGKQPQTSSASDPGFTGQSQGVPQGSVPSSGPGSGRAEPGWFQQRRRRRQATCKVIPQAPSSSNSFEVLHSIPGDSVQGGASRGGSSSCPPSSCHVLEAIVEEVSLVPEVVVAPMPTPPTISVIVNYDISDDAQGSSAGVSSPRVEVVPVAIDPMIVSTVPMQMVVPTASVAITPLEIDLGSGPRVSDLVLPPTIACQSLPLPGRTRSQKRRCYRTQKSQTGLPYGRPPDSGCS